MRLDGDTVVLEKKNCHSCNQGTARRAVKEECPNCLGTGRAKGGKGKGRCNAKTNPNGDPKSKYRSTCFMGEITVAFEEVVCPHCEGNYVNFEDESYTDSVPEEIFDTIPWEVLRSSRAQSWAEQYIGMGLVSCTDYGAHKEMTDEELIAKERESSSNRRSTQLCKVVRAKDDLRLADAIVIITADNGYSVVARYNEGE